MEENERIARQALPGILIAAVVQGWVLYALHLALRGKYWPATDPAWLIALYAVALIIPVTVQLLADHFRKPVAWTSIAALAVAFFYIGWNSGASLGSLQDEGRNPDSFMPFAFEMAVLWLLMLPFLQSRIASGSWHPRYETLFATAWRNKLMLAEALLFTGAFWLLLVLWRELFGMLGMRFFKELFQEPVFIYPVTSLVFGVALHLIGSVERFTAVVLEQLLNVLKWLAIVAGLILALFTVALAFKLPGMISTGDRAIGAAWLLWLVAVIVLLVNAAYRDGTVEHPYPRWIANALRLVMPLTVIVSLTALYALTLRTSRYGLTAERVWAFVVAGAAVLYSIGYATAACRGGRWMSGIARVNILVALALIATLTLALTPVLSPYRLAANSQAVRVLNSVKIELSGRSSFDYLRFEAGEYGIAKLRELEKLESHPRAAEIRKAAAAALLRKFRGEGPSQATIAERLAAMKLYPAGAVLDEALRAKVAASLADQRQVIEQPRQAFGVFIDLNGNGSDEFVFVTQWQAFVFEHAGDDWSYAGRLSGDPTQPRQTSGDDAVKSIGTEEPKWRTLVIDGRRYRADSDR